MLQLNGQCSCIFHGYVKFSAGLNFWRGIWQPREVDGSPIKPIGSWGIWSSPNFSTVRFQTSLRVTPELLRRRKPWTIQPSREKLNVHWDWLNRPSNLANVFFPFFSIPFPVYRSPMNPSDKMWQALGIFVSGRATGWWFQLSPLKNQSLTWLITGWRENLQ